MVISADNPTITRSAVRQYVDGEHYAAITLSEGGNDIMLFMSDLYEIGRMIDALAGAKKELEEKQDD